MLVIKIFVGDIIFGAINESVFWDFPGMMKNEFETSMMGEITFFIGLQIKQTNEGIFINPIKYVNEINHKFGMDSVKTCSTLTSSSTYLV